jgi:hypothetical protein
MGNSVKSAFIELKLCLLAEAFPAVVDIASLQL